MFPCRHKYPRIQYWCFNSFFLSDSFELCILAYNDSGNGSNAGRGRGRGGRGQGRDRGGCGRGRDSGGCGRGFGHRSGSRDYFNGDDNDGSSFPSSNWGSGSRDSPDDSFGAGKSWEVRGSGEGNGGRQGRGRGRGRGSRGSQGDGQGRVPWGGNSHERGGYSDGNSDSGWGQGQDQGRGSDGNGQGRGRWGGNNSNEERWACFKVH